ncbi:hypothetical protein [Paenibacillus sp. N3.4]|uniref:hypothetical protein n=1 Tax=Paenibacillus sp. N3.4 TaxID=2603222 RepID=UPI0021C2F04B|nr:hypothetical protein [Paenibacillus sp. N3.4]
MNRFYRPIGIIFILSLLIMLFTDIYSSVAPSRGIQLAKQGVLDLTSRDFRKQGLVTLDGEWEFYEGKLLEPTDFRAGWRTDVSYLSVPGTWNGKNEEQGMSRKGFGTYRLKVLVNAGDDIYGVKLRSIRMSNKLYINGKLEGESGRPGVNQKVHIPGNTPYSTFFYRMAKRLRSLYKCQTLYIRVVEL